MSRCEEFLRDEGFTSAVLWVLRDNPRARAFYEKAGWHFTGRGIDVRSIGCTSYRFRQCAVGGQAIRSQAVTADVGSGDGRRSGAPGSSSNVVGSIPLLWSCCPIRCHFASSRRSTSTTRARYRPTSPAASADRSTGSESYVAWFLNGRLDNPGRNHPAYRRFRASGQVKYEMFYEHGQLQDPSDRDPAVRGYFANGMRHYEEHYRDGKRNDAANGNPAVSKWRADGTLRHQLRFNNGRRVTGRHASGTT